MVNPTLTENTKIPQSSRLVAQLEKHRNSSVALDMALFSSKQSKK
jgi:hypothetical protein